MESIILLAVGVVLLISGFIYVFLGYRKSTLEEKAVPIKDFNDSATVFAQPSIRPLTEHILNENLKKETAAISAGNSQVEDLEKKVTTLKDQVETLSRERKQLNEALAREMSSKQKDLNVLSEDQKTILAQKEEQLLSAKESLDHLTSENHRLTQLIKERQDRLEQRENELKELNQQLSVVGVDQAKLKNLEQEVESLRKDKEGALQNMAALNRISQMNQQLASQAEEKEIENRSLTLSLVQMKVDYEKRLSEVQRVVEGLQSFKASAVDSREVDLLRQQLMDAKETVKNLQMVKETAVVKDNTVEEEFTKAKKFNEMLMEREKILNYELMKARAQITGLEKICEDFKSLVEKT